MKCTSCGADIQPGVTVCEYCDSSVELAEVNGQRAWLIEHVKQSAEYARRDSPERLAAVPRIPALINVFPIIFSVVFTMIALVITLGAWRMAGAASAGFGLVGLIPLAMSIVPIGFVVLGIFIFRKSLTKAREYKQAPVEARAAVIVGRRTAVSGGSNHSSASTCYFVTAEFEDGRRQEFQPMRPSLFGRIAEGDAGVLFSRSDVALDFDRVGGAN